MNKKIISLGLASVIVASSAGALASSIYMGNHTTVEASQANFKQLDIQGKKLDTAKSKGEVDITIPQFKGLKDTQLENKINKDIENNAKKQLALYEEQVKQSEKVKSVAQDSILKVDYEIKSNSYIASVIVNTYMITPGQANGEIKRDIYNIDVEQAKLVNLEDLFKTGTNYKEVINKNIKNEIEKNKDAYFPMEKSQESPEIMGFKGVDKDTKFYINNVGDIVITYDLYEIAPRSTGVSNFLIPNSDVKTILVKEKLVDTLFTSKKMKPNSKQDVSIIIPEITGLKNANFEKDLNAKIKLAIDTDFKAFETKSEQNKANISSFYVDYEVYLENQDFISFKVSTYNYNGGDANGENKSIFYNIDVKNGKTLELKDLFKANANYKDIINKDIKTQIEKDKNSYFQDENGFKSISDNQKFHFDKDGNIVIAFDQYEIAPRSTGSPEFTINKDLLKNIIK